MAFAGVTMIKAAAPVFCAGVMAAIWAASPLASQGSGDAALEAACRATEVTEPGSCGCTITKAREVGVPDAALASLFRDDGHSDPVDQATYGKFWQVKAQCIAEATMARMGIGANNPLPGVPAHMRPGQPLGNAPVARPAPSAALTANASTCAGSDFASPGDVVICGDTGVLETSLVYDRALEAHPALLSQLRQRAQTTFAEVSRGRTQRDRYGYVVAWNLASQAGSLVSVTGADGFTSRGRLGGSTALLWDAERGRMIAWEDVFGKGLWNGRVARDYCTALRVRFTQMEAQGGEAFRQCPQLDTLTTSLVEKPSGDRALSFSAAPGVITAYATSALYDEIELPLDAALLAAVQPPYRAALGAPAASAVAARTLLDRLGTVVLGPPHFAQAPECVTEFYLQPASIGNPGSIADIRALVERSPGLVMVTGAGMLGSDEWRSGVVLDGRFVDLAEGAWDERLQRSSYSGAGMTIHYEERRSWAEPSYGGWGHGDLVVRSEGEASRIPVLQQSWQCT